MLKKSRLKSKIVLLHIHRPKITQSLDFLFKSLCMFKEIVFSQVLVLNDFWKKVQKFVSKNHWLSHFVDDAILEYPCWFSSVYDDSSCTWEKLHVLWFCVIAIYAPMIYMAPYVMFLMRADPLRGKVERVGPWKSRPFWALWNGIKQIGECHLGPNKVKISSAGPPPIWPSNGSARIKYIVYRAV